jgi:serine/threonine protein kinase
MHLRTRKPTHTHTHRRLGHGAYGVVVAARDSAIGKRVAIKKCFNIFQSLSDAKKIAREVRGAGIAHATDSHTTTQLLMITPDRVIPVKTYVCSM